MKTYTSPRSDISMSRFETGICALVLCVVFGSVCHFMGQLPTFGGQPTPLPVTTQYVAPALAPLCWDRTREQVQAEGAEPGCPTDPMAYRPASLRQVQG